MGRLHVSTYMWSIVVMSIGAVLWFFATYTAIAIDNLSLVPRAGTILIATGVLSLILLRSFVEPADAVFNKYWEIHDIFGEELKNPDSFTEPFTKEEIEQVKKINQFMHGEGYRGFKKLRRNVPFLELGTIFVGTIQTGYGDLLAQLVRGQ